MANRNQTAIGPSNAKKGNGAVVQFLPHNCDADREATLSPTNSNHPQAYSLSEKISFGGKL